MVMEMTTSDGNPMFLTIDKFWDDSVSLVFPKKYEQEARNRTADIGSYLHFKHGDEVLIRHFTPSAAARAIESPWNDELQRAESPMDKVLASVVADCDAIDWLRAPDSATPDIEFAKETMHHTPLFNNLPNDDNSLESIRLTSTTINPPQSPHNRPQTLIF